MTTKRENIACRPGTTDEMQRLADENEALRAERDSLAAQVERLKWAVSEARFDSLNQSLAQFNAIKRVMNETPAQSIAHIRAAGAREALERAMKPPGFSGTVVRVDVMREIIEQMKGES